MGRLPKAPAMKAPPYSATPVDVLRLPGARHERDSVAVEEPLEIRVNGSAVAVTMRTPGHDEELALGFLVSEGINPQHAAPPGDLAANTIEVEAEAFDPAGLERHFYTSSSCGVCGKGALEAVAVEAPEVASQLRAPAPLPFQLPQHLPDPPAPFSPTRRPHTT